MSKAKTTAAKRTTTLGTGAIPRNIEFVEGYEKRPHRRGRPVYLDIEEHEALLLVRVHHDHNGGVAAIRAGAELVCGSHVVRRKRKAPAKPSNP